MTVAGSWVKHRQMITKTLSTLDPSCECTTVTTPPSTGPSLLQHQQQHNQHMGVWICRGVAEPASQSAVRYPRPPPAFTTGA